MFSVVVGDLEEQHPVVSGATTLFKPRLTQSALASETYIDPERVVFQSVFLTFACIQQVLRQRWLKMAQCFLSWLRSILHQVSFIGKVLRLGREILLGPIMLRCMGSSSVSRETGKLSDGFS